MFQFHRRERKLTEKKRNEAKDANDLEKFVSK